MRDKLVNGVGCHPRTRLGIQRPRTAVRRVSEGTVSGNEQEKSSSAQREYGRYNAFGPHARHCSPCEFKSIANPPPGQPSGSIMIRPNTPGSKLGRPVSDRNKGIVQTTIFVVNKGRHETQDWCLDLPSWLAFKVPILTPLR